MKIIDELDEAQRAAATSNSLKTCVVAGAGTGKTKTLTARIAWLLSTKALSAENVVAVTFTERAARELKERVIANVGAMAHGLRLGTFHSLAFRILRKHAVNCGFRDEKFMIVDDEESRSIMRSICLDPRVMGPMQNDPSTDEKEAKASEKEYSARLDDFADACLRQISLWKSWGLTERLASEEAHPKFDENTERMLVAYSLYQHELERRNLADFGDLILKLVDLFDREPAIRDAESNLVHHLLVDEAQDANQVQIRLVHHLSHVHGALTIVGDDDQNIYGFQGGYAGAMNDLIGEGASRFTLSQNRRCTEEILSAANTIVGFNKRSAPKRLSSGRHGAKVFATGHVTDINEAAWVAQQIEKLVASGVQPSQVAVLFRSKFAIPPFEEALARVGVPSIVMSGTSLLQREEIKDVVAFLRLALNDRDDVAFSRIANKPARGLGPVAVDTIISLSRSKGVGFHEVLQIASDETNEFGITKAARNGMRKLASALSFIQEDGRWNRPPFDVVTTVLTATGYSDWLQKQDNADVKIGYVEALHRLSESYEDLETFLADIALMSDVETSTEVQKGRVKLMTMHACKGLEFDHVFCAGFDEGVMPSSRAIDEYVFTKPGNPWVGPRGGGLEEERRLCHVAFTRARHSLTVSFPMRRAGIKGKMRATGPSFFLEECDLKWKEMPQMTAAELGRKNVRMNKKLTGYDR